jgi:penicillin-binding protein 1C
MTWSDRPVLRWLASAAGAKTAAARTRFRRDRRYAPGEQSVVGGVVAVRADQGRRGVRWLAATLAAIALLAGAVVALDRLFPPDLSRLAAMGSEVVDRQGRTVALRPAPGGVWRFRTTADDVPPAFLDTLIATEDRHFWQHPGVNPLALVRAALADLRAGRIVSGGSTLTMQAARLLEPRPRTVRAKLIEIGRALQLEAHFSKRDILGIWLTLAPMGGNLEGVRAGALAWFGHGPQQLEPAEAALLVAIPRRPEALRPDRHPDRARLVRNRVLRGIGETVGLDAPVPAARVPLPRHVLPVVANLPRAPRVVTTLDLPLQAALERLAAQRLQTLPPQASLALLIADARSREIRALVPGDPHGGAARAAALDLTRAIRSPGSALKPFIYALAFQDGLVGPETVLSDLPRHFGGYAPENFDRGFHGPVTAGEALRESLNLPAVALLDRVGPLRFLAALKAAGVTLRLPPHAAPSLPLALGGDGISLRQAAGLYAALATDGQGAPLRLLASDAPVVTRPFLDPRAAATVADELTQRLPDGGQRGIAWKTGTSWGGRDAWALGFNRDTVVGVWVGRPDGTPLPAATGRSLAVPLLSHVFDLLPEAPRPAPQRDRVAVARRDVPRADTLRLLFPPDQAVLSDDGPVTLRAMGGRRPLTFLIDGARLDTDPARREVTWAPDSPGFYQVTVLDADGAAAHVAVRVR